MAINYLRRVEALRQNQGQSDVSRGIAAGEAVGKLLGGLGTAIQGAQKRCCRQSVNEHHGRTPRGLGVRSRWTSARRSTTFTRGRFRRSGEGTVLLVSRKCLAKYWWQWADPPVSNRRSTTLLGVPVQLIRMPTFPLICRTSFLLPRVYGFWRCGDAVRNRGRCSRKEESTTTYSGTGTDPTPTLM